MFRIEFFCDDQHLGTALQRLVGISAGEPVIRPVVNAHNKNGKVVADGSGATIELFVKFAKAKRLKQFSSAEMKEFCQSIGKNPTLAYYFTKKMIDAGVVDKVAGTKGSNMRYVMVKREPPIEQQEAEHG